MSTALVPVRAFPVFDPDGVRCDHRMPVGMTVAEIIRAVMPGIGEEHWGEVSVMLVTPRGVASIDRSLWHRVRPNAGVHTIIRVRPDGPAVGSILTAVLSSFAVGWGQALAAMLVPAAGALQTAVAGIIAAGITIVGSLLIQALIPQPSAEGGERRRQYTIEGWRNDVRRGEPVPLVVGKMRYAPPFAAPSYTEIVDGQQYVRALFTFGYGRVDLSDLRIGETPIEDFENVQIEIREGTEADEPLTLYPEQVHEEPVGVELKGWYDSSRNTTVVRTTVADTERVSVILSFPAGLWHNEDGDRTHQSVTHRIRQRLKGTSVWSEVATLTFRNNDPSPFYRQYTWELPFRGQWDIEFRRMSPKTNRFRPTDTFVAAIQSIRPEFPVNFGRPLSLVAVRVRASYQLTGTLDNFNAIAQRYAPVWDGEDWAEGLSRNPASACLAMLQSPANPQPAADGEIDLDQLADWYEFCVDKDLKYDRVHDRTETLQEGLQLVCAAGRATPSHDGVKRGVVIDRPQEIVVDHLSPRNSSGFSWSRTYFDAPDAFRVSFLDETNDYIPAERLVPWPGHSGEIRLTEALELPGKTDPDEIWIEARRRMYELIHRPDRFMAAQDFQARVLTRGDLAMGSRAFIARTSVAARILRVDGSLLTLDEEIDFEVGTDYGVRFRTFASEEDTLGTSHVVEIAAYGTTGSTIQLLSDANLPTAGSLVHVGPLEAESIALRVRNVERTEDGGNMLHMLAAAPEIDTLTDAEEPPAWNGQIGGEVEIGTLTPAVPYIAEVLHGLVEVVLAGNVIVLTGTGAGETATVAIRLEHKLSSEGSWTALTFSVAEGGAEISGYSIGDEIDLRVTAIAFDGTESAPSETSTITIGAEDPAVPAALDEGSIVITPGLGHAHIALATGSDAALDRIQVYRVPSGGTLDTEVHAVGAPFLVEPSTTVAYIDGDSTRINILADGEFNDAGSWTADANWTVAAGVAAHAAGAADTIQQGLSLVDGTTYRGRVAVSGRTAGDVTPELLGGTTQSASVIDANGTAYFAIDAVSGNTAQGYTASSDFDGDLDDAILFAVTAACVGQGDYDYYLEPQNSIGGAGPITSAIPVTIT